MVKMFSPFVPFLTEYIFQKLVQFDENALAKEDVLNKSVHFQMLPEIK